ncbi:serine/threonine-protein phosphatase 6 regulatory ankyrin repeat subunit C-like [Gossypium australe]|uniref:Serine/threonine-protein phosphatase 6 regulatory ankyrin repeat subunit C-like n=1 Tax=Gossypium australe TaxID=47621 RepID=A0A5B6VAH6_9ROSI|nr:serine/threonine-protein phosphatase 6 regulatory ankyrin repeat subunit C-like [Gossypium australe]
MSNLSGWHHIRHCIVEGAKHLSIGPSWCRGSSISESVALEKGSEIWSKRHAGPKLELPPEQDRIDDVFHVFMLTRYQSNPSHLIPIEEIKVRPDLSFEEEPVQIL